VTNDEIVKALPQLKDLKIDLRIVDDQIKGLLKQREQLQDEIRTLNQVTDIIDGIAVCASRGGDESRTIYGKMYRIGAADHAIERSAEVYPNAHTSEKGVAKDWGIKLYGPRKEFGGLAENFLGTSWGFKDAVEVVQRWVTRGEVPSPTQQELLCTRHKLDPQGRAPKRRRDAFEAAWLAGHKDLAKEILLGRAKVPKSEKAA
jgi:hypothetical protein